MSAPNVFDPVYYQRIHDLEERHWWHVGTRELMAAWLEAALTATQPYRVLDVGCGTGYVVNWLRRFALAGEPIGVDLSAHALAFGRGRGAQALALATANCLPFSSADFDLVVCLDTIQHVAPVGADQVSLNEFARLLRPGGHLYLRTNSAGGHAPLRGVDPNLYRRYRISELEAMLRLAGLKVERASHINCLMSGWALIKEYLNTNRVSPAIGPGLAIRMPPVPFNTLLRYLLLGEAWLTTRLGLQLPFGHSIVVLAHKPLS
jgi:ubiquinone/menaquinone biosynthesis C-methylase UbiE